jgi:hypothetical protein
MDIDDAMLGRCTRYAVLCFGAAAIGCMLLQFVGEWTQVHFSTGFEFSVAAAFAVAAGLVHWHEQSALLP